VDDDMMTGYHCWRTEGKVGCGKGRRDAGDSRRTMDEGAVSLHCYATRYGYRRKKQSDKQAHNL
jgi:hypothetical protein